jgi:AcrR family transcriptional regulator
MKLIRLESEMRRKAIIEAAMPLFALKGFAGTKTKEISERAGVSEALVFKHFPSKQALYQAIMQSGKDGDPAFERLNALPPSTEGLITMIHLMVSCFLLPEAEKIRKTQVHGRLKLNSFLEDGEFARLASDWIMQQIYPKFAACYDAALAAGDLTPSPATPQNLFWFAEHLASMLGVTGLPEHCCLPYEGSTETLSSSAVWFILRGIGLKDQAIRAYFRPVSSLALT